MKSDAADIALSFMGMDPPEVFRCRVYLPEPREPLTEEEARAEVLKRASQGGFASYSKSDPWPALEARMSCEGLVHFRAGHLHLGPDPDGYTYDDDGHRVEVGR